MIYFRVHLDEDTQLKLHYNNYLTIYTLRISIYLLPTYIRPIMCLRFLKPFSSYLKIRNDWYTRTVLKWFSSYILNRSSSVKICNFSTKSRTLHYGIPHRSVLGPLLFSIYILPIHNIIGQFPDVHYHIYADDIQLYSFLPNSFNVLPDNSQLCKCTSTIRSWLLINNLLLNSSNSALLNIPSNYHYFPPVIIDDLPIIPS